MTKEEIHITYAIFLPKMFTLNVIMRTQSNTNCVWDILQGNGPRLFKNVPDRGKKKKKENLFSIKGDITTKCNV